jgi:hypothetical protein
MATGEGRALRGVLSAVTIVVVCLLALGQLACSQDTPPTTGNPGGAVAPDGAPGSQEGSADAEFARAFADKAEGVVLEGGGSVERLLDDDLDGARHQRFIVRLGSGQTLLVAHNIDIAPRVAGLQVGDTVRFKGEYEWNAQGGVIHWTHHDPAGGHPAGWIEHEGRRYQ